MVVFGGCAVTLEKRNKDTGMGRVDLLLNTLKEQYHQKESPAVLLQTLAQLQAAVVATANGPSLHLGTAKIAVMMPVPGTIPTGAAPAPVTNLMAKAAPVAVAEPLQSEPLSVNESNVNEQPLIADLLSREPIRELKKAIGINDRFLLIKELFEGNEKKFEQAIKTLDTFSILAEAAFWMEREIKAKPGYQKDSPAAILLDQLVSRRFS